MKFIFALLVVCLIVPASYAVNGIVTTWRNNPTGHDCTGFEQCDNGGLLCSAQMRDCKCQSGSQRAANETADHNLFKKYCNGEIYIGRDITPEDKARCLSCTIPTCDQLEAPDCQNTMTTSPLQCRTPICINGKFQTYEMDSCPKNHQKNVAKCCMWGHEESSWCACVRTMTLNVNGKVVDQLNCGSDMCKNVNWEIGNCTSSPCNGSQCGVTAFSGDITPSGSCSSCNDDQPPPSDSQFTCQQQKHWNKCSETWMKGYCCKSCDPKCDGLQSWSESSKSSKLEVTLLVTVTILLLMLILFVAIFLVKTVHKRRLKKDLENLKQGLESKRRIHDLNMGYHICLSEFLNYNTHPDMNISHDHLEIGKPLGSGYFGSVVEGKLRLNYSSNPLIVAVKIPRKKEYAHYSALVAEFMIMSHIGVHVNLLAVYGVVVENMHNGELSVVFEYCQKGSLLSYLKSKETRFFDQLSIDINRNECWSDYNRGVGVTDNENMFKAESTDPLLDQVKSYPFDDVYIFTSNLIQFAYQIANGMNYLCDLHVIHRDLALRNILVTDSNVLKIADFGLALDRVYNTQKSKAETLPVKWMAPEAIKLREFSNFSDIWSFGIVLYELFTLGQEPFDSIRLFNEKSISNFHDALINGMKPIYPYYAPKIISILMNQCLSLKKEDRPLFEECKRVCGAFLHEKFPIASEALKNLLKISQPYMNVRQSELRATAMPKENII